jgi:GTP-binding protein EngB required for normal cell division
MLLLVDLRRTPSVEDIAMAEWSAHHKKPLILIFTKSDKVGKVEEKKLIESKLAPFSSIKNIDIRAAFTYSIKEKTSRERLVNTINLCLNQQRSLKELHASS